MTRASLIESLRGEAKRDAESLHDAASAAAGLRRSELAAELEQERTRLVQELTDEARRVAAEGEAAAQRKACAARADADSALAQRLLALAREELPRLAEGTRERLLEALAGELPRCEWQRARVNPRDAALAARLFPAATIDTDAAISGGMELEREDGRVCISNTLETRLETAWPDLLPGLIAQIATGLPAHGTAA